MIQFKFAYTKKAQENAWIATGKRGSDKGTVVVDELTLTPEQRAIIAPHLPGLGFSTPTIDLEEYRPEPRLGAPTEPAVSLMAFDSTPTLDAILNLLPQMREEYQRAKAEAARLHNQRQAEQAEDHARLKARQEQQDAAAEADKQRRLAERAAWIATHGSERLRKCQERGYDCARLYMVERAAVEYPGFVLDYNDSATWDSRKGPSLAALKREEELAALYPEHEISIVWLTCPASHAPDSDQDTYGFEPHEAIALRPPRRVDYLDHHGICWLVQDL